MLYLKFFFIIYYINLIRAGLIENKLFDGIVMHPDRLDGLCHGKNVTYQVYMQGIKTVSTKVLVENCTYVSKQGGFKKIKMKITINRCRSKENLDTCELYLEQGNIDFCKGIDPNNLLISNSPLYVSFVPPLKCPINKGTYHAYNVTYDLAPFIFFKLDGWYWKIKSELFSAEHNKLLYCMYVEGYVTNSKSKTN